MSGKCRPSLREKTLCNVEQCNLSQTDKDCIKAVFEMFEQEQADLNLKQKQLLEGLMRVAVHKAEVIDCKKEIERQKAEVERMQKSIDTAMFKGMKVFAERLKEKFRIKYSHSKSCEDLIDNLLKEMENKIK